MAIDFSDYEKGEEFDGDYGDALKAAQERLSHIQAAYICRGARAIIVFEGWDAAGKGGVISRMTGELDPRHFDVWPISAPTDEEKQRHFLWRFWKRLPRSSNICIFDRSWYGRVLVERVEGFASEVEWRRAYDEINEFEAQQKDCGTTIIKLFLHVSQEEQDRRLKARLDHPWKRWKTGLEDFRNRARRADYLAAAQEMFDHTDTRWAPWKIFDSNNKKAARIVILNHVADRLEQSVDMTPPPLDDVLLHVAGEQIGYRR